MNDSLALQRAKKKLATLRDEAARVETFIAMLEEFSEPTEEEPNENITAINPHEPPSNHNGAMSDKPVTPSAVIYDRVRVYLREAGEPLTSAYLLAKLENEGINVGGRNPKSNLGAKWSFARDLKSDRISGWWFKNEPTSDDQINEAPTHDREGAP